MIFTFFHIFTHILALLFIDDYGIVFKTSDYPARNKQERKIRMKTIRSGAALPFVRAGPSIENRHFNSLVKTRLTTLCENNEAENGDASLQKKRSDKIILEGRTL